MDSERPVRQRLIFNNYKLLFIKQKRIGTFTTSDGKSLFKIYQVDLNVFVIKGGDFYR